jgi:hypothetical protein
MGHAIVWTFNSSLDKKIRKVWKEFEEAGIGKTPGQLGEPPHITVSAFPGTDPNVLVETMNDTAFVESPIRLIPFGAFLGEKQVLFYHVVLTPAQYQSHVRHFEILRERRIDFSPTYAPGNVHFHCTLAVGIEKEQFQRGIEICWNHPETLEGTITGVELFEFFPVKIIRRRKLE